MHNQVLHIKNFCIIRNQKIWLNDELIFESKQEDFHQFAKEVYQHFDFQYPKFHKMDALSKLAFLLAEFTLNDQNQTNTALIFANKSASLDTDIKHQNSIANAEEYYPSPAVFVYTLPNITIGEVSIRHQLKSESSFLIDENFSSEHVNFQAEYLIQSEKSAQVLCGWTEYFQNNYEGFVYLVAKNGNFPFTEEFINDRIINHGKFN